MSKISEAFANEKALVAFITAGDPSLKNTKELINAIQESGADLILLGLPFTDKKVEGEAILAANERSLLAGTTIDGVFNLLKAMKDEIKVPIVLMTYADSINTYGQDHFMHRCIECGIPGVLIPDLPYEESTLTRCMKQYGIERISVITPSSREEIQRIAKDAEGFIYCAPDMEVAKLSKDMTADIDGMVALIRGVTEIPCAIGFGIVGLDQAKTMAAKADGLIVGSTIIKMVADQGENSVEFIKSYVRSMKSAVIKA